MICDPHDSEYSHDDFSNDEASHDALPDDGVSHSALSDDEASHAVFSHNEAPHGADEASFHASAASVPYGSSNGQGSVMHLTGDPEGSEVGRLLVQGDEK
jgi:hypothetical protein